MPTPTKVSQQVQYTTTAQFDWSGTPLTVGVLTDGAVVACIDPFLFADGRTIVGVNLRNADNSFNHAMTFVVGAGDGNSNNAQIWQYLDPPPDDYHIAVFSSTDFSRSNGVAVVSSWENVGSFRTGAALLNATPLPGVVTPISEVGDVIITCASSGDWYGSTAADLLRSGQTRILETGSLGPFLTWLSAAYQDGDASTTTVDWGNAAFNQIQGAVAAVAMIPATATSAKSILPYFQRQVI